MLHALTTAAVGLPPPAPRPPRRQRRHVQHEQQELIAAREGLKQQQRVARRAEGMLTAIAHQFAKVDLVRTHAVIPRCAAESAGVAA